MAQFPGSPQLIHAGFVLLDASTGAPTRILALPMNPQSLSRSLDPSPAAAGPVEPHEVINFVAMLDASDALANRDPQVTQNGLLPLLSALELLMYSSGPANSQPLVIFVWGARRVLPVRVLSMQIVEQNFDSKLNPILVQVSITMQSLKDADLPANSRGRSLWDVHLQVIEQLATLAPQGTMAGLGLTGV